MRRRSAPVAVVIATLLLTLLPSFAAAAPPPLPSSMAAVGDSITQAASSGGSLGTDYPANSWSTGTNSSVDSQYLRILSLNPAVSGHNANRSVSGSKMADLNGQMQQVVALQPDYVTVLIGGNDICTDTEAQMTSVTDFRAQFEAAMSTVSAGAPNTDIFVASIPRVLGLWELFHNSWWARFVWSVGDICQSLLANPTSTQSADVQRRARVAQRNVDFNQVLADVCAITPRCLWDSWAVYDTAFTSSDVSGDYFHPSVQGQAKLAAVTWAAGYWAGGAPPGNQPPTAAFTYACTDLACTFDGAGSSDSDGTIAAYAWTFGDGGTSTGVSPAHAFAAAGSYLVSLTVTDDGGATGTTSQTIRVTAPQPAGTMHVAALTGTTGSRKGGWTATVSVTVRDANGAPVSGATVGGSWSSGGSASCTTAADGRCSSSANVNRKTSSITYAVTGIQHATLVYDPALDVANSLLLVRP